jgi:hypothetical protein
MISKLLKEGVHSLNSGTMDFNEDITVFQPGKMANKELLGSSGISNNEMRFKLLSAIHLLVAIHSFSLYMTKSSSLVLLS